MEKFEQTIPTIDQYKDLADQLDNLQKNENEGRGISCVRTIILYLNRGEIDTAKAVCKNEGDKISNYEEIKQFLVANLFKNESDHPWNLSDKY